MDDAPERKRRWCPYSLPWPLFLALLLSIPCIWFVMKMEHAGTQKAVVEEIENMGGLVWYDYQFDTDGIPSNKEQEPPGPVWLRRLLGDDFFMNVTKLDLTQTEITDAGLKHLDALTDLQSLALGERISDTGLEHLRGLTQLHTLDLRTTKATNSAISDLRKALPHCAITVREWVSPVPDELPLARCRPSQRAR